eukprot:GHVT01097126.1.p1 GENE.GHVT01097126.1~~GHVT01097126.1.p1  ORF type:complete len:149 (+),score=22.12 GHVT01097126.1:674-1120(+)
MSPEDNEDPELNSSEGARAFQFEVQLNYDEAGPMVENSHFISWMKPAAFSTFRKLYGVLGGDITLPLWVHIGNLYPLEVQHFDGRKAIVLVSPSPLGGQTLFIGICYLIFSFFLLLLLLFLRMLSRKQSYDPRGCDIRWHYHAAKKRK